MRALVVGADGFVGRWLVRHLAASGDTVAGIVGPRYRPPLEGVEAVHQADVRDLDAIRAAVSAAAPDAIYYLAAVSQAEGREDIAAAAGIAVVGSVNALVACAELRAAARFLYVSSAHVYGDGGAAPLNESARLRPTNVYGAAKAAAEAALLHLGPAAAVDVVIARPFNHVGPGQRDGFLVPSLASQVAGVARGEGRTIRVAAPQMVRDFTDVRDVVRAYRLLVEHGQPGGVYNVASGEGRSVEELVGLLLEAAGVTARLEADGSVHREGEPTVLIGDPGRVEALGWARQVELRRTLSDTLAETLAALGERPG